LFINKPRLAFIMRFTSKIPGNAKTPIAAADYLAGRFTYHNKEKWIELIREGRVFVNDVKCDEESLAKSGDTIAYAPRDFEEPAANLSYSIIYEDEWMLCVNKPGNLLVHRAGKSFRNNLVYLLRHANTPQYPNCHPVHRLDRNTSGAVLFAKTAEQGAILGNLFRDNLVTKRYVALVLGHLSIETPFSIDKPIAPDPNATVGTSQCKFMADENGKPACTIIEEAKHFNNGYSLLTVRPLTGRTHQIRVHLASIGFPIAGDSLYGGDANAPRQALHCESLSFVHPYTNTECTITAPLPEDIRKVLSQNL